MSRSHGLALAAFATLLASTLASSAQAQMRGQQCVPAVPNPAQYSNCRIANVGGEATCRCEVSPQALRQPGVQAAAAVVNSSPRADVAQSGGYLSPAELRQMYSGRTWMWSEGGGYFHPNGTFHGAVGNGATTAFVARGTWSAGAQGELCFSALWNGQVGRNDERTCFYHRAEGGKILQRKGQSGEWYTFRSAPGRAGDEYNKLVQGDRVSPKLGELRSRYLYGIQM